MGMDIYNSLLAAKLADGGDFSPTTEQLAAMNSGITAELVTQIGTNTTAIAGKANSSDVTAADAGLQAQIDQIAQTAGTGTADTEIAQARVGADGTSYQTLKARLDGEFTKAFQFRGELTQLGYTSISQAVKIGCYSSLSTTTANLSDKPTGVTGPFSLIVNNWLSSLSIGQISPVQILITKTGDVWQRFLSANGTVIVDWASSASTIAEHSQKIEAIEDEIETIRKPLKGLNLSLLGDSISAYAGTIPEGNDAFYTGSNSGVTSPNQMWWKVLCNETEMIPCVINGWSGSAITQLTDSAHLSKVPMSDTSRCQALHDNDKYPDVILIAGGVNDYTYAQQASQKPSGWDGKTAPISGNSFDETYAVMIKNIQTAYPNAVVVCLSTWFTMRGTDNGYTLLNGEGLTQTDYDEAIERVAKYMRVPYINVERCGFSRSNFYPTYAQDSSTIPTHPNKNGQKVMGEFLANVLPEIVKGFVG